MNGKAKKAMRMVRRPFEWFAILLGLAVLSNLPRRAMQAVCDFASAAMYAFDRRGRRTAAENLKIVFGDIPESRARAIVKRSYRNMARSVGHAFWTCRNARRRAAAAGEMAPSGIEFLKTHKQAVTVSGHIGCWEILSQLAFLHGHSMASVAKDIGTPGMTKLLMKARRSIGQEIVHAKGAFPALMQAMKDGKSLGLLVDQSVKPENGGIWVRFFGVPVPVSTAPAFFAKKWKVPVVVAWSRPLKDGRYRCEPVAGYAPSDVKDLWGFTSRCMRDLEKIIRRHPSCWVLNYRTFRRKPSPEELAQLEAREAKAAKAHEYAAMEERR